MGDKVIEFNRSVYELCTDYPELKEMLADIGFTDILKSGMLNTAGRFMTLEKGARFKKIDLEKVRESLAAKGYIISV